MRKLFITIAMLFQSCSHPVFADQASTDTGAHFGVSYTLTAFTYGLSKKALRLQPLEAYLFSSLLVSAIGLSKEYMDKSISGSDIVANQVGVLTFGLTMVAFEF
jgi:hypothetical protein